MAERNAAVNPQPLPMAAQPQYVLMPVSQRNGLGVFGLLVALIGFVIPTGLIALLGLLISLVALGKSPRGFAMMGVVIGLLGSALWLIIDIAAVLVGLVMVVGVGATMAVGFMLTQPEVVEITGDMINSAIAIEHYHETEDAMPDSLDSLGLSVAAITDPWGTRYRYELVERANDDDGNRRNGPNFELTSAGPDSAFGTDDDIMLSRLGQLWGNAFDTFEEKMEQLSEKVDSMNGNQYAYTNADGSCAFSWGVPSCGDRKQSSANAGASASGGADATRTPVTPDAPKARSGSFAESYEREAAETLEQRERPTSAGSQSADPQDTPETPEPPEPPDTPEASDTPESREDPEEPSTPQSPASGPV